MNEDILADGPGPARAFAGGDQYEQFSAEISGTEDEDGQPDGLSPDIAREIARRIGVSRM